VRAAWRPASAWRRRLLRVHAANAHGARHVEPTCREHQENNKPSFISTVARPPPSFPPAPSSSFRPCLCGARGAAARGLRCACLFAQSVSRHMRCAALHCAQLMYPVQCASVWSELLLLYKPCCTACPIPLRVRALPAAAPSSQFSPKSAGRIAAVRAAWRPASACRRRLLRVHAANAHGARPVKPTQRVHHSTNKPSVSSTVAPTPLRGRRHRFHRRQALRSGRACAAREAQPPAACYPTTVCIHICVICLCISAHALCCTVLSSCALSNVPVCCCC
jgi:hypothetical protein